MHCSSSEWRSEETKVFKQKAANSSGPLVISTMVLTIYREMRGVCVCDEVGEGVKYD